MIVKQLYLEGKKRENLDVNKWMELEYYLTKDTIVTSSELVVYGISIMKRQEQDIEMEETGGVSESEELVKNMIQSLLKASVTPMSMLEVVDDMVTERMCS
jgi:hypothetical protein